MIAIILLLLTIGIMGPPLLQLGLVAGCFLWFLRPPLTCGLMRSADVPTRRRIIAVETLFTVFYVACFIPMFEGHNGGGGGFGSAMFASVFAAPSAM